MSGEVKKGRGGDRMELRLSGENAGSAEAIGETLTAMDGLFKAVAEEMKAGDVRLVVEGMRWVCDGCERTRPDDHADWIKRDGLDFCPACTSTPQLQDETDPKGDQQ